MDDDLRLALMESSLAKAQTELDTMRALLDDARRERVIHDIPHIDFDTTTIQEGVVRFVLEANRPLQAGQVVDLLTENSNISDHSTHPRWTIYNALDKGAKAGKLVRPQRGLYAPNLPAA